MNAYSEHFDVMYLGIYVYEKFSNAGHFNQGGIRYASSGTNYNKLWFNA